MRLLRSLVAELPDLQFKTQLTDESSRPDMWGMDGTRPRVFLENKFWAGLTGNQPVSYLEILAKSDPQGVLLFVAPEERKDFLWRELTNRLRAADIKTEAFDAAAGVAFAAKTGSGPIIALTSWNRLIAMVELEIIDEPEALANIHQLKALCRTADVDAFMPFSPEETSDQRIPALIRQCGNIVQKASSDATNEAIIRTDGLRPIASWEKIGRYIKFASSTGYQGGFGAFFGVDLDLWHRHGETPLWLTFGVTSDDADWRRAAEVRALLEPAAHQREIFTTMESDRFAIALKIPTGEEMQVIVESVVRQLRFVSQLLAQAPPL